ncbi:MAG: hypothetical protein P0S96_02200 [Simkaniaceae bacterium]|nr:hypothetical protein [Candidatus Sacchlamyda saccharinae]
MIAINKSQLVTFQANGANMKIQSTDQSVFQQAYSLFKSSTGRYSLDLPGAAGRLNKIAIPAIALFAISNLGTAMAGPIEYAACTTGCTLFATPVAFPGCVTACLPLLFLPGP